MFSNLFIILSSIYAIIKLNRININRIEINIKNIIFYYLRGGIINVGLGSMYFHYKKNFLQLFDELPMSILIILYVLLVNKNKNIIWYNFIYYYRMDNIFN